jgi:hypothetical protein
MAAKLRSTSAPVVAHEEMLMRMAGCPCQTVGPRCGHTFAHPNGRTMVNPIRQPKIFVER